MSYSTHTRTSVHPSLLFWTCVGLSMLFMLTPSVRAAIPAAATNDARYALGYLVVTNYAGVDPTGVGNSTAAIQTAINDARDNHLVLFFPPGTYTITNTLRCYSYALASGSDYRDVAQLAGSKLGAGRPVIKLAASASAFGDTNNIRPMIAYRLWTNHLTSVVAIPANPFVPSFTTADGEYYNDPSDLFDASLRNIDFDCNGNAGAVGVSFDGAQNCNMDNVKVFATGAYAGFYGTPAGVGGAGNLEVEGGRYGLVMGKTLTSTDPYDAGSGDAATFPGLRLVNQTVCAIMADNYSGPVQAVGFYIKPAAGARVVMNRTNSSGGVTSIGTFGLFDGTIDMTNNSGAVAITNADAKSINIRNVYVTGTDNLIKSGSEAAVTGTGTWKLISEYVYTDQRTPSGDPPYEVGDVAFRTFSIINGTTSRTPVEPVKVISNNVSAPPADLLSRHIWSNLPSFEDGTITSVQYGLGTFMNPIAYGATAELGFTNKSTGSNDSAAFQAAIDAASTAGHGRVVVPRGEFHLTNTLTLRSNTILMGANSIISLLRVHDTWKPTNGSPFMVQTVDDANATTYMGWLSIVGRTVGGSVQPDGTFPYDRFSHVLWRAGRKSMTVAWTAGIQWNWIESPANPRTIMTFSGKGGGRHYGFSGPGRVMDGTGTRSLVFNGTTEPLWMYTCNVEATKGTGPGPNADMNICITNSANIRLIGMKREGNSPTVLIYNSTNIGLYGHEDRSGLTSAGDIQILGSSTNILLAGACARNVQKGATGNNVLREAITGLPALSNAFPECISIYQRGALNEAAAYIDGSGGGGGSVPAAPSGLAATVIGPTQIDLDWTDNANNETGFRVKRAGAHLGPYSQVGLDLAAIGGTGGAGSYSDTNVVASTTYYYVVSAFNGTGETNSAEVSATTTSGGGGGTLTTNTLTATQDTYVEESNPTTSYGTGTEMRLRDGVAYSGSGGWREVLAQFDLSGIPSGATIQSATLRINVGQIYSGHTDSTVKAYRVTNSWSESTTWNTRPGHAASAESTIGITTTGWKEWDVASLVAAWQAGTYANNGIKVRAENGGWFNLIDSRETANDPELVVIYDSTTPSAPSAPSGLTATAISYNQINLAWTDNANNETGFTIERKMGSGGTYAQIVTLPANAVSYGDSNALGAGTLYYYRIAATNASGSSAFTETNGTTSEITSGRAGHWKLDEGSGTTTADSSGNGNTGTLGTSPNNPAWTASGKIGGALKFDGVNDEVNVGHGASLSLTNSTTWAAWIYPSNAVSGAQDIISKRGGSGARGWSFYVEQNSLRIQVCDYTNQNNSVIRTNATLLQSNQWYHVAGVYNGSARTLDVYVNGTLNNGGLVLSGLTNVPAGQFDAPANDVYLGRKNAASEYWNGMLDDARIYNRALSASEIGACYNAGLP